MNELPVVQSGMFKGMNTSQVYVLSQCMYRAGWATQEWQPDFMAELFALSDELFAIWVGLTELPG